MPVKLGMAHLYTCILCETVLNSSSRFNASLARHRRQNLCGVYDTQTNVIQYPRIMQATHARWKQLPSSSKQLTDRHMSVPHHDRPLAKEDDAQVSEPADYGLAGGESMFSEVTSVISRNFMVADICYVSPPMSGLGYPGPEEDVSDVGPGGLLQVPDCIRAELPAQCLQAYDDMRITEIMWKDEWGTEEVDRARGQLRITYNS